MNRQSDLNGRSAGILLPVFSLPSSCGIGTPGKEACVFADHLKKAGVRYWQILPIGQPGSGNSPYSCVSSFAGNPLLIDPELLEEEGLLLPEELRDFRTYFAEDPDDAGPERIRYEKLKERKLPLLRRAYERAGEDRRRELRDFCEENKSWLLPYLRFMILKEINGGRPWNTWKDAGPQTPVEEAFPEEAGFYAFLQYVFYKQWNGLHSYVNRLGIRIIGDLPIYVPFDSVDVWSEPEQFRLAENSEPAFVSGVPPDAFSETGQLWGNPVYDYRRMAEDGYGWWIRRVGGAVRLADVIRIDHFRGFASYYVIPAGEADAGKGFWEPGPGMDLVGRLTGWFPDTAFIAEDLGMITDDVRLLLEQSGLPGMRVLEFAFAPGQDSSHLPHHHTADTVCYTGTHDNAPLALWEQEADKKEVEFARAYLGTDPGRGLGEAMIRAAYASVADLTVVPMQDWLGLGAGARINIPGIPEGNWTWRMKAGAFTEALETRIRRMGALYGRGAGGTENDVSTE